MKWQGKRRSSNIEDRRGQRSGGRSGRIGGGIIGGILSLFGPAIFRLLFSKKGLFIVGAFLAFSYFTGTNPLQLLMGGGTNAGITTNNSPQNYSSEDSQTKEFLGVILGSTEDIWNQKINNYREPTLVVFKDYVTSACGQASSATGPFYCPGDEKLYIDMSFFDEMANQLGAPGDFAQAYVVAHEVGHHIQKILGITDQMRRLRGRVSKKEYNKYSVRLELQADFLAGVWAHHAQKRFNWLEMGDLEEAMNAANAIGDDRLQKNARGHVVPDSFTHGTSEQRMRWFRKGYETGDLNQMDTFSAKVL